MPNQDQNIAAVYNYFSIAKVLSSNTVIIIRANVLYFDRIKQATLFNGETDVFIDTTQEDKISIPVLSYDDHCFSEFSTKYQDFVYSNGALTISGKGYGQKNAYSITLT